MQKLSTLILLGLAACGGDTPGHDTHGSEHEHPDETASCDDGGNPPDEYVAGISYVGAAGYEIAIAAATPAPPDVGVNSWTLQVTDPQGAPVTDGTVVVTPFMPLHGHGTTPETFDATSNGDGTWSVPDMDLFMPGLWELQVGVTDSASFTDVVLFRFCLEG